MAESHPALALAQNCRFRPRCDPSEVMVGEIVPREVPQNRKIGKAETPRNCSGDLTEIRPPLAIAQNCRF